MIVAVVDPRGEASAEERLRHVLGGEPLVARRSRGGVVLGQTRVPWDDETTLHGASTLEDAASASGTGAFACLDADVPGAALLARGSLGGRPLFYAPVEGGAWIACSRLPPLLRGLGAAPRVAPDHLAFLATGLADPSVEATVFDGVARVAPCTAIRLEAGSAPVRRKRPHRVLAERVGVDVEELAEELWRRFEEAVARAIAGARKVAVMVGGGVDSSGLLAMTVALARGASRKEACEVVALAMDYRARGDDRPYREALARHLDIVPVTFDPREASPWFDASLVLDEQPYALAAGPMEQLLARRARALGADVLLAGYLADEILAGDLRSLGSARGGRGAFARGVSLARGVSRAARIRLPWPTSARARVAGFVVKPLLKPHAPLALLAKRTRSAGEGDFPWVGEVGRRALEAHAAWAAREAPPTTAVERFARFERSALYADYADMRGQVEAETGVVRRDPYADEGVLELIASTPPWIVSHGDWHRGLFRHALRGHVPEMLRLRADKAWFEPAFAATAAAAGGLASLGDLWRPRALERLGVVDAGRFQAAMSPLLRHPSSSDVAATLWSAAIQVLACESFARRFEGAQA